MKRLWAQLQNKLTLQVEIPAATFYAAEDADITSGFLII